MIKKRYSPFLFTPNTQAPLARGLEQSYLKQCCLALFFLLVPLSAFSEQPKASPTVQVSPAEKRRLTVSPTKEVERSLKHFIDAGEDGELEIVHRLSGQDAIPRSSLNKVAPLATSDTLKGLNISVGTPTSPKSNLCTLFSEEMGIESVMSRYLVACDIFSANADIARIRQRQTMIKTAQKATQFLSSVQELMEDKLGEEIPAYNISKETLFYLFCARDFIGAPLLQLFKHTMRSRYIYPSIIFDVSKYVTKSDDFEKFMDRNPLNLLFMRYYLLVLHPYENLQRLDYPFMNLKNYWEKLTGEEATPFIRPFEKGFLFFFFLKPFTKFLPRILREWGYNALNFLHHCNLASDEIILFPFKQIQGGWEILLSIRNNILASNEAINVTQDVLHTVKDCFLVVKRMETLLKKDPAIRKAFSAEIRAMHPLLHRKKYRKFRALLHSIARSSKSRISVFDHFKVWDMKIYHLLYQGQQLDGTFDDAKKDFLRAMRAVSRVDVLTKIALKANHSDSGLIKKRPYTMAQLEVDDQQFCVKDAFLPLISRQQSVSNDIHIGKVGTKVEKNLLIAGYNGGGKSVYLRTIGQAAILAHAYGIVPGREATFSPLDTLCFLANEQDDLQKGNSLFMQEGEMLNKIIQDTQERPDSSFLILLDEPARGTVPMAAAALVTSIFKTLHKNKNCLSVTASHLEIIDAAKHMGYKDITPYAVDFVPGEGFNYKIIRGMPKEPAFIHILEEMDFDKETLDEAIRMLGKNKHYKHRHQLPKR